VGQQVRFRPVLRVRVGHRRQVVGRPIRWRALVEPARPPWSARPHLATRTTGSACRPRRPALAGTTWATDRTTRCAWATRPGPAGGWPAGDAALRSVRRGRCAARWGARRWAALRPSAACVRVAAGGPARLAVPWLIVTVVVHERASQIATPCWWCVRWSCVTRVLVRAGITPTPSSCAGRGRPRLLFPGRMTAPGGSNYMSGKLRPRRPGTHRTWWTSWPVPRPCGPSRTDA